jgi:tetrahydromethanopterin S-methyltransferase subunit G
MMLHSRELGIAFGLIWGLGLFVITWWIMLFEGAIEVPTFIGLVYRGYSITPLGSLLGLLWGLADGFVVGLVFGWLYNRLVWNREHGTR